MRIRTGWRMALPLFALGAAGCFGGRSEGPTSTVSGKVSAGRHLLAMGQINFFSENQERSGVGIINPDGTYTVTNAPTGKTKVTISMPPPRTAAKSLMAKAGAPPVAVPARYRNAATTDITVDVAPGSQNIDIKLKER